MLNGGVRAAGHDDLGNLDMQASPATDKIYDNSAIRKNIPPDKNIVWRVEGGHTSYAYLDLAARFQQKDSNQKKAFGTINGQNVDRKRRAMLDQIIDRVEQSESWPNRVLRRLS
jgi:hypothetical protein